MIFIRNSNHSKLSLEEQKLKLLCIITECEIEVGLINSRIDKQNRRERKNIVY